MRTIYFRADANPAIGFGHISRCLSLATFLKNKFRSEFILTSKNNFIIKKIKDTVDSIYYIPQSSTTNEDASLTSKHVGSNGIIVLDGYNFDTAYQEQLLQNNCKVVCIDDINQYHYVANVIINHAEGIKKNSYSTNTTTQLYLGLKYAMINPVFLKEALKKDGTSTKKKGEYFINMGGSDPFNNTLKVAAALIDNKKIKKIHIVIGKLYPYKKILNTFIKKNKSKINIYENILPLEVARLLKKCEVAICPSSTISIESCAVGIGLITGLTAENQLGIYKGLLKNKCAFDIGNINNQTVKELAEKIDAYILNKSFVKNNILHQRKLIDGKSPERFLKIFNELATC